MRDLARVSGGGAACTCVVTEYCYREGPGFGVAVEYFGRAEVEAQLGELLEAYRHFHLTEGLSEEEKAVYEGRARVAKDTFEARFPGRKGDMASVLLGAGDGGDEEEGDSGASGRRDEEEAGAQEERVLRRLMSWVDAVPRSATAHETFEDAKSCAQRLMELTSADGSEDKPALWPFIRKIRWVA